MLTPKKLRSLSKSGRLSCKKEEEKITKEKQGHQSSLDLLEAQVRIKESEEIMSYATSRGINEARVCVLRRGIHFEKGFDTNQDLKFLGNVGKTIYDHFIARGFKVEFRYWMDGMRIGELEEDSGYEVVVSW